MALRAAIQYMGHRVIRELGLGCHVPASVSAGATSMRVMDASLFDPAGGTVFVEDIDNLVTYTGINGDQLTGIPASSTGSITATINPYTSASRDLIWRCELITATELEAMFDRYRRYCAGEAIAREVTRKIHSSVRGWYDTGVELRDDDGDSYSVVAPDTSDYENGVFSFNSARSISEQLYVFGWGYNPYAVIGDFIEAFANDQRWYTYSQAGQTAHSKKDALAVANEWRMRGKWF